MNNPKRIELQAAYVLHRRPYRETSVLLELFTPELGRLSAIAKGVRKLRSPRQGLLQAFTPLTLSWVGKGELMTLTTIELRQEPIRLKGDSLYAGFYLNELMMALLEKWDAHPGLFVAYERALLGLQQDILDEVVLRTFELQLLTELGYGILSQSDAGLSSDLKQDKHYRYVPEQGFVPCESGASVYLFSGKHLLAIANKHWELDGSLLAAKRLIRQVLMPLLGNKQINSRFLFAKHEETA